MGSYNGQSQLAAPIENFARLHAGFLLSAVYHRILSITMDFQKDFHEFPSMGSYNGKAQSASIVETFARFQAGFVSSEAFHRILSIFIDFHGILKIFMDFRAWGLTTVRLNLLPLQKPLLGSRLASCHLKPFIVFFSFSQISIDFRRFVLIFIESH